MTAIARALGISADPMTRAAAFLFIHIGWFSWLLFDLLEGVGSWITWTLLAANIACLYYRLWQLDWLGQVKRFEATPKPIDPKLFMPYSTCPSCGDEQLHWLQSSEITDFPAFFKRVCEFNKIDMDAIRHLDVEQTAREWAAKRAQNCDVIRECRACAHTWGQKVGQP